MMKNKTFKDVQVAPATRLYEMLDSGKPESLKSANRLHEYCLKAEACGYELKQIKQLREQFKDVV